MFTQQNLDNSLTAIDANDDGQIFAQLLAAHQGADRFYHNDAHVADCLSKLDAFAHLAEQRHEIAVAIWFHDAVYDAQRSDNEAQSAAWAERYLLANGADAACVERIVQMILATKTHTANSADEALLIDIDLSILGETEDVFEAYDRAIRQEYAFVPEAQYRQGRSQVLQRFLARDEIFSVADIRERYEHQARQNLIRKIAELKG